MKENYYIIFGAQMVNKGAQAMLFNVVSQIRQRDSSAKVVVFIYDKWKSTDNPDDYSMEFIPINMKQIMNLSNTLLGKGYIIGKRANMKNKSPQMMATKYILKNAKMAFDISGYALSSQWGVGSSLFYLSKFALLKQYNIPTYVMPQSFGPFNYGSWWKSKLVKFYTKRYLRYPEVVFAREESGFEALTKEIGLTNVKQSNDLVLQSTIINSNFIYSNNMKLKRFEVKESGNVAIIPNSSNDKYGDPEQILELYHQIIKELLKWGKNIYLLSHSEQDQMVCDKIMEKYNKELPIYIVDADMSCIEYAALIRKFDYAIASRFHSIVNAYKEGVPCISLGWAQKYYDLLKLMNQQKYHFDVRELTSGLEFIQKLGDLEEAYKKESKTIINCLKEVQKQSCFDFLNNCIGPIIKNSDIDRTVNSVACEGLCTGCGVCKAICPKECITYELKSGFYQPQVDANICIKCGKCFEICPGRGFDYEKHWSKDSKDKLIGDYKAVFQAESKNEQILSNSTSGGVVTNMVLKLLESKQYDRAFLVDSFAYDKQLHSNSYEKGSDLFNTSKSRYLPVAHDKAVEFAIKNKDSKIIFVGTSCFIHGLIQVIESFKLNRDNYLLIGLFCDRTMNYNMWEYFSNQYGDNQLAQLYFRDKKKSGWPGDVKLIKKDGECLNLPSKSRTEVKDYFQIESCLYCMDKLNQFADISVGDNYADKDRSTSVGGSSSIIIRSQVGEDSWKCVQDELNILEQNIDDIVKSQHLNLRKKNYTFLKLKCSALNKTKGFFGMKISYDAIKEYEERKRKITIGRDKEFKCIKKEINNRQKLVFFKKVQRKLKKLIKG